MKIAEFAKIHRLNVSRDDCGDPVVKGKLGDLYEYSPTELGVCFLPLGSKEHKLKWNRVREECIGAGMTLRQHGDAEGCLSFDPANVEQAKQTIRSVGARQKRRVSPERQAQMVATLSKFREGARPGMQTGSQESLFVSGAEVEVSKSQSEGLTDRKSSM